MTRVFFIISVVLFIIGILFQNRFIAYWGNYIALFVVCTPILQLFGNIFTKRWQSIDIIGVNLYKQDVLIAFLMYLITFVQTTLLFVFMQNSYRFIHSLYLTMFAVLAMCFFFLIKEQKDLIV